MKQAVTLKKNHEFRLVYQRGQSAVGGCMVVYCRKNVRCGGRLGITASTKLGNAVRRNRARRRLRELYRLNRPRLRAGYDLILVARSRTVTASWGEMNATFFRLCKKLNLLAEDPGAPQSGAGAGRPSRPAPKPRGKRDAAPRESDRTNRQSQD